MTGDYVSTINQIKTKHYTKTRNSRQSRNQFVFGLLEKLCVCVELFNNDATENDLHVPKNHKKHRWIRFMIVIIWHCFPVAMANGTSDFDGE